MTVTLIDPPGLPRIDVYRQVSVATGSRLVHVAGQVDWEGSAELGTQVERCFLNVATALAGVGATFADVVKLTLHVVDWRPDRMPEVVDAIGRAYARIGVENGPPASLFGIVALDVPEHLAELEAVAVLD